MRGSELPFSIPTGKGLGRGRVADVLPVIWGEGGGLRGTLARSCMREQERVVELNQDEDRDIYKPLACQSSLLIHTIIRFRAPFWVIGLQMCRGQETMKGRHIRVLLGVSLVCGLAGPLPPATSVEDTSHPAHTSKGIQNP